MAWISVAKSCWKVEVMEVWFLPSREREQQPPMGRGQRGSNVDTATTNNNSYITW